MTPHQFINPVLMRIDTNAPTSVKIGDGLCFVQFGEYALAFADATEAEAALDEACLALRLLTVGGVQ